MLKNSTCIITWMEEGVDWGGEGERGDGVGGRVGVRGGGG